MKLANTPGVQMQKSSVQRNENGTLQARVRYISAVAFSMLRFMLVFVKYLSEPLRWRKWKLQALEQAFN